MGFSGGGSNVLSPHTHDGTVTQDGGPLNFNNVTQSQSASGEIFFSDGVHIQQLPIGAPNDQIRVSGANLPEYFTPAAGASTWTKLADITVSAAGGGALDSGTWVGSYDFLQIFIASSIQSFPTGGWESSFKFNNDIISSGNYSVNFQKNDGAALSQRATPTANAISWGWTIPGGNLYWSFVDITVANLAGFEKFVNYQACRPLAAGNATPYVEVDGGAKWTTTAGQIQSVQVCDETGKDTGDRIFKQGSRLVVLGLG